MSLHVLNDSKVIKTLNKAPAIYIYTLFNKTSINRWHNFSPYYGASCLPKKKKNSLLHFLRDQKRVTIVSSMSSRTDFNCQCLTCLVSHFRSLSVLVLKGQHVSEEQ